MRGAQVQALTAEQVQNRKTLRINVFNACLFVHNQLLAICKRKELVAASKLACIACHSEIAMRPVA